MNLAYAAGFFDGEGSAGFGRARTSIFPRVLVTNTNREILEEFQKAYGGDIQALTKRKPGWKQGWYWRVTWSRAVKFLADIEPYVQIKSDQLSTVFAWDAIRLGSGKQTALKRQEYLDTVELLVDRMHWLNQRGPIQGEDPINAVLDGQTT